MADFSSQLDFDTICRHVGRLYLEHAYEAERLAREGNTQILQLREQLQAEQRRAAQLEQRLAAAEQPRGKP